MTKAPVPRKTKCTETSWFTSQQLKVHFVHKLDPGQPRRREERLAVGGLRRVNNISYVCVYSSQAWHPDMNFVMW